MQTVIKTISGALASVGAYACYLIGGWDAAIKIMLLFMLLDYATGLTVALTGKSPKTEGGGFLSQTAFLGLTRKLLMMVVVIMATALDRMLGVGGLCRIAAIGFYAANEGLSIVENLALMGVPFPKGLRNVLTLLRDKSDAEEPTDKRE